MSCPTGFAGTLGAGGPLADVPGYVASLKPAEPPCTALINTLKPSGEAVNLVCRVLRYMAKAHYSDSTFGYALGRHTIGDILLKVARLLEQLAKGTEVGGVPFHEFKVRRKRLVQLVMDAIEELLGNFCASNGVKITLESMAELQHNLNEAWDAVILATYP